MTHGTALFRCGIRWALKTAVLLFIFSGPPLEAQLQTQRTADSAHQDILRPQLRQWLTSRQRPIRIGVTAIPPQIFRDPKDGTLSGLCIDFIREIESHLGYSFEIVFFETWNAMMEAAFAREIDVVYATQTTPSRQEAFAFTEPYLTFSNMIVATKDVKGPLTLDDLAGKTVAVVQGAAIEEYLHLYYPTINLLAVEDELIGLSRVSFHQADAMVIEISRASWYIQQYKFTNLRIVGDAGYPFILGFACRIDQPELVDILNAALAKITPERRKALINRWILPLEGRGTDARFLLIALGGSAAAVLVVVGWNRMLRREVRKRTGELENVLQSRQNDILALRRYKTIISLSDDLMAFVDADGVFRAANDALLKALGKLPEEVINRPMAKVFGKERYEQQIRERFEKALRGQTVSFEMWTDSPENERRYFQGVYHPHQNGSGGIEGVVIVIHDMTDREKTRLALEKSQQALSRLLANLRGIAYRCKFDKDWTMEFLSQGCEEMTGFRDRDFYDGLITWGHLILAEDREYVWQEISRHVAAGEPFQIEYRIRDRQGQVKWFWEKGCGVFDSTGQAAAIEGFITDITDRKQAEQTKEHLLKELRTKNEELESIVFIASHDLRSPLVNIRGFAGELEKSIEALKAVLNEATLGPQIRDKVQTILNEDIPESLYFIKNSSQKVERLLNGLLRLSRIGTAQIKPTVIDTTALVSDILGGLHFTIRENHIDIAIEGPLPRCRGDVTLVTQVFENLIDNAIKYRRAGHPCRIRIRSREENGQSIYQIEDNGIGIAPEHLDKVFEIFHQLRPGSGGEGLGLTIVRRILDRQDGQIVIASDVEKGTTVSVTLPAAV